MAKIKKYPKLFKLKELISEKGYTYRSISAETGISLRRINDIINGYTPSYLDEALSISKLLGIDTKDIPIFFA